MTTFLRNIRFWLWNSFDNKNIKSGSFFQMNLQFQRHFRVCILGSGPSGLYTAKFLLRNATQIENASVSVDLLDILPHPFGLIRTGVAPDHLSTKNAISDLSKVLEDPRVRFFGNLAGVPLPLNSLRNLYDAVVLASGGAEDDRKMGILNEDKLSGVYSAREFVNWYNGHPFFSQNSLTEEFINLLSHTSSVCIVGQGNVAIDVARILLSSSERLKSGDMASYAVEALMKSKVKTVYIVGRRGPVQAAFTTKELREVSKLEGVQTMISRRDLEKGMTKASVSEATNRAVMRKVEILKSLCVDNLEAAKEEALLAGKKVLQIRFLLSPTKLNSQPATKKLGSISFERNTLVGEPGQQKSIKDTTSSQQLISIDAQMLLRSIGYKARPIEGAPFDSIRGIIPSVRGRVVDNTFTSASKVVPGLYVTGWLKRGPQGIIGTNISDAQETAESILQDWEAVKYSEDKISKEEDLAEKLREMKVPFITWEQWKKVDAEEKRRGVLVGKPREKITTVEEMLHIAEKSI